MTRWIVLTVLGAGLVLAGCGATNVTPLGSDQYAIECTDGVSYCARKANEVCPDGMDVVSNTANAPSRSTMIVRCRKAE
jgi:hypothetical protein